MPLKATPRDFSRGRVCIFLILLLQLPQSVTGFGVSSVLRTFRTMPHCWQAPQDSERSGGIVDSDHARLRLISFDLDDTLFPTTEVVRAANLKMLDALEERGCGRVALSDYLATTKAIRKGLNSPSTYQGLRKMTLKQTFLNAGIDDTAQLDVWVDECYQAWEQERHLAAERFLYEDAIETLQTLKATYRGVVMVAITNGAGDPLEMKNSLAPYFDFTVSGEMDEVFPQRKPDSFIYEYTLQQYKARNGNVEESFPVSGGWVHVGDCLANDVGASSRCGAHAIWFSHEKEGVEDKGDEESKPDGQTPEWSTATPEEVAAREKQVEDGKKYVSATIYRISELPEAIKSVLAKQPALQEN